MKIKTIFVLFFLLFTLSVVAQPSEYTAILDSFSLPDKVISLEFSKDPDGLMSFSLQVQTEKTLQEMTKLLKSKFGLSIASVKYDQAFTSWTLLLKSVNENLIDTNSFFELLNQDWSTIPKGLSVLVSSSKKSVSCNYSDVKSLEQNMKIAQRLGLKISGSISHENSSVAIFSKDFKAIENLPEPDVSQNDIIAGYLKEFGDLVQRRVVGGGVNYTVVLKFDAIVGLLSFLEKRDVKIINFNIDAHPSRTELKMKLIEGKNNNIGSKLANLKKLLKLNALPWVSQLDALKKGMYVTGLNTGFGKKIMIHGITSKSSLIFSRLFTLIKRFRFIESPFFTRGTYSDYECGRMMKFSIDCSWY